MYGEEEAPAMHLSTVSLAFRRRRLLNLRDTLEKLS